MDKVIQETLDRTQGDITKQQQEEAAMKAAEELGPPSVQPEEIAREMGEPPQAEAAQSEPQLPVPPPVFQPTSYMQIIPAEILFSQHKRMPTPLEQQSNVRLMWRVVAERSTDPVIKRIFERLARG